MWDIGPWVAKVGLQMVRVCALTISMAVHALGVGGFLPLRNCGAWKAPFPNQMENDAPRAGEGRYAQTGVPER